MTSNFITPVLGKASELGVGLFEDNKPIALHSYASLEEIEVAIKAIYRQVLGNAYVMESERLGVLESQLECGEITVREFVRNVAKSELYRSRFFDNCPRYRAIELNFKHLLGRAPESYEETSYHSQILDRGGHEDEVDSYLDSDEYQDAFGDHVVPYYRGYKTQTGKKMVGFTHLFKLLRGASSSDKNLTQGNNTRLNQGLLTNSPSAVILPSGISTYGGQTDINKLLAEMFKTKAQPASSQQTDAEALAQTPESQALQRQYTEQEALIAKLTSELAGLSSAATIGTSQLTKWQSTGMSNTSNSGSTSPSVSATGTSTDLQQRVDEQKNAIAELDAKIMELRRLAVIGEASLNKWRQKTFF